MRRGSVVHYEDLSEDEVTALLAGARTVSGAERARLICIVELLYATGMRVSELVGLPLATAVREQRVLLVRGKGEKERLVPPSEPAPQALAAYRAVRGAFLAEGRASPWLFPSRHGGQLSRQSCATMLK
jgi:integrase/recombinase XerD